MEGRKGEKNREWKMVPLLLPIHLFIFILFVKEMGGILSSSVALGVDDRVVFVRIPKTGSSSFVNWVAERIDLVLPQCDCQTRNHVFSDEIGSCFFQKRSFNQTCECLNSKIELPYPCPHRYYSQLTKAYLKMQTRKRIKLVEQKTARKRIDNAKLYMITILRHPVDRLFSEFNWIHAGCPTLWKEFYSPTVHEAICQGDFIQYLHSKEVQRREMTTYLRYFSSRNNLTRAKQNLEDCAIVLTTETLSQGFTLLAKGFSLPIKNTLAIHANPTKSDPTTQKTEKLRKDPKMRREIELMMKSDMEIYEHAKILFAQLKNNFRG